MEFFGDKAVMVVEDTPGIREALVKILEKVFLIWRLIEMETANKEDIKRIKDLTGRNILLVAEIKHNVGLIRNVTRKKAIKSEDVTKQLHNICIKFDTDFKDLLKYLSEAIEK